VIDTLIVPSGESRSKDFCAVAAAVVKTLSNNAIAHPNNVFDSILLISVRIKITACGCKSNDFSKKITIFAQKLNGF
jgi:hypothetical protein